MSKMRVSQPESLKLLFVTIFCLLIGFIGHAQRTIVTIGDSNGANENGWANQLKSIRTGDSIFNYSISGNTVGFDNLNNEKLNTLKNIDQYLADALSRSASGNIDDIVVLLGTNDCKKVFEDRGEEVVQNLQKLVEIIQSIKPKSGVSPEIYIVSPPPIGPDSMLLAKYQGGDIRIRKLLPGFLESSLNSNSYYIDIYNELKPEFASLSTDGIHLNEKGSRMVAQKISGFLDKTAKNQWDDQTKKSWPSEFDLVEITSSLDNEIQKAYFHKSKSDAPQPLIVSLHTWSGDYTQTDPLIAQILEKDWNYIHPDFRGVNNTPKALGNKFAIQDIEDAISYAMNNSRITPSKIHVIGASGGGYASLYTFMNSRHDIHTFSAWVPISDIEAWYYQSAGRKNKYADHILSATSEEDTVLNVEEARNRSPLFMETPVQIRKNCALSIYAGIHDGYQGSVPVNQSILFYNKVIKDFGASDDELVSNQEIMNLLSMRTYPELLEEMIGDRQVIFKRRYKNIVLTLFEGSHEMLTDVALDFLVNEN